METRGLGRNGPQISAIGLGTMGLGGAYGPVDEAEAIATVRLALDNGVNLVDTADFYGAGAAEELLGKALADHRGAVSVATKTGVRFGPDGPAIDGRPDHIRRRCDESLGRLGTDHIELYYLARIDPSVPVEDSVGALSDLVTAGKVGRIGLCEVSPTTLRRAAAVHPVAAVQTEYSLWERHVEDAVLPAVREIGATLVAYRTLGSGFLTGRLTVDRLAGRDARRGDPRLQGDNLLRNLQVQSILQAHAERREVSAAQLAVAWVLSRGPDVVALIGTGRRRHLLENLDAAELTLDPADADQLARELPPVAGDRYPAALLRTVDV